MSSTPDSKGKGVTWTPVIAGVKQVTNPGTSSGPPPPKPTPASQALEHVFQILSSPFDCQLHQALCAHGCIDLTDIVTLGEDDIMKMEMPVTGE